MSITAAVGQAHATNGRDAGSQAALQALTQLGKASPAFGIVLVSHDYPVEEVLDGVTTPLGNVPLFGFSTTAELTSAGHTRRSVSVALLAGSELQARAHWQPGFSNGNPQAAVSQLLQTLQPEGNSKLLLFAADGLCGDTEQIERPLAGLTQPDLTTAGCLVPGDMRHPRTYQIGGQKSGTGGIAGALLSGNLTAAAGVGHGWQPVGSYFKVSRTNGPWVRSLDEQSAAEVYARLFGYEPREWGFPPLNELVRLYPLGIEQGAREGELQLQIRAPLRMETDGSLRMNASLPEGAMAHVLMGSATACAQAARNAASQAVQEAQAKGLKGRPSLAILLVDTSWEILLEGQPGAEVRAVRSVLGNEVPVIGGYTVGQYARPEGLLNQHIGVVVLGEERE